jgi:uncharacterized membrane protein YkvI
MKNYSTAAVFICTILGAGFATGQELLSYFVSYGIYGIAGIVIAGILFGLAASRAVNTPYTSYSALLKASLPTSVCNIILCSTVVFTVVICSGMFACVGELAAEYYPVRPMLGSFTAAVISSLFILRGREGLSALSRLLFPLIAATAVIVSFYLLRQPTAPLIPQNRPIGLAMPVVYVSYNVLTAITVILPYKGAKIGWLTAGGIILIALSLALPIYRFYGYVEGAALPVLSLLPQGSLITLVYLMLLLCAVFTTAISTGCSAAIQLTPIFGSYSLSAIAVTVCAFLLSGIGFANIVSRVYFIFGIIGVTVLYSLIYGGRGNKGRC